MFLTLKTIPMMTYRSDFENSDMVAQPEDIYSHLWGDKLLPSKKWGMIYVFNIRVFYDGNLTYLGATFATTDPRATNESFMDSLQDMVNNAMDKEVTHNFLNRSAYRLDMGTDFDLIFN